MSATVQELCYRHELRAVGRVDRDKRTVFGYVIAQAGPFKSGRGAFDQASLEKIVQLGNAAPLGIVSRITHPEGDSTGKLLGRATNFRLQRIETHTGTGTVLAVLADLRFSNAASKSPEGDWPEYLMSLIEEDASAVSTSLVLETDIEPRRGAPPLWRPTALIATDIVDVGDAVDSILAAAYLSKPRTAKQKRRELDMAPLGENIRLLAKPDMNPRTSERPVIVGYAAVFGQPSVEGDVISRDRIRPSILTSNEIRLLVGHDYGLQFASTNDGSLSLSVDDYGLRVEVIPLRYSNAGNLLLNTMLAGGLDKLSLGYGFDRETRSIERVDEVSLVANPKRPQTTAKIYDCPHRLRNPWNHHRNEYMRNRLNLEAFGALPPGGVHELGQYRFKVDHT